MDVPVHLAVSFTKTLRQQPFGTVLFLTAAKGLLTCLPSGPGRAFVSRRAMVLHPNFFDPFDAELPSPREVARKERDRTGPLLLARYKTRAGWLLVG